MAQTHNLNKNEGEVICAMDVIIVDVGGKGVRVIPLFMECAFPVYNFLGGAISGSEDVGSRRYPSIRSVIALAHQ
jgi:hypothetical protein